MLFTTTTLHRALALLASLLFTALAHAQYTFTTFSLPGTDGMQGWGINSALRVPGNAYGGAAPPPDSLVFDYATGTLTPVPSPGGGLTALLIGINNAGQLTGSYTDGSGVKGVVLTGSFYDTFFYPGGTKTYGRALNNTGLVTGYAETGMTPMASVGFIHTPAAGTYTTIAPTGSTFTIAQGVNDAGVVVGSSVMAPDAVYAGSPAGQYGWVRQPSGTLTFFRVNGLPSRARGINSAGEIVGWVTDSATLELKSFKVTVPGLAPYETITVAPADYLVAPGAAQTIAEGINDAGFVSGSVYYPDGSSVGFVAAPPGATLLADLHSLIERFALPKGMATSLLVKVKAAASALERGDTAAACGNLKALINHAEAQSGKKLTVAQANQIIATAQAIRVSLGC
ncbi:MAG: hypothetical protein JNM76_03850 [Betaproteobacteria bacterium]|nr:hypothetical protein [Betaproteobacteria bacterium]